MTEELDWVDEPELQDTDGSYISASRVKSYRTCPKQYWYKYKSDIEPTKAEKGYRLMGSAVHDSIEQILTGKPPEFENKLNHDLKKHYRQSNRGKQLRRNYRDLYNQGLDCLETAARYIANKTDETILGVEKKVEFSLGREDIQSNVVSIMDVTTDNDIWDWKTGRISDDGRTAIEEKIQGAIYMRSYQEEYGKPPEAVRFIYLKEETERKMEPSDKNWEQMIEYAANLVRGEENDEYPAKPGGMCFFCGYESHCPDSKVGVGSINPLKF